MNALMRVARDKLCALGLPGTHSPNDITELVLWLEKSEGWKFGELDLIVSVLQIGFVQNLKCSRNVISTRNCLFGLISLSLWLEPSLWKEEAKPIVRCSTTSLSSRLSL